MDSFTLTLVIVIFLCCLGLHFATALAPPITIATIAPPLPPVIKPLLIRPAVLRQNVAIARLMRIEELGWDY
jgi:hypothetical protein